MPYVAALRTLSEGRRRLVVDAGLALLAFGLAAGAVGSGRFAEPGTDARGLSGWGIALVALASLPLVARRFAPLTVFSVITAASVALYAFDYALGPPLGSTIALFGVASSLGETRTPKWVTLLVVGAFLAWMPVAHVVSQGDFRGVELLLGLLVWGGAWVAGTSTRWRRERMAELEERAGRAEREAERERRLAAAEERTRIARDLHDSAGHAVNVILVQAGAARLLHEQDPDRSREALATIEDVARETIGEIDRLVRVLRDDGRSDAAVEPPPGLAAVETLADRHRAAGLDVTVAVHGERRPLPPRVDRAAYRILQEALTNATLHGRGGAEVEVAYGPSDLELTITNATRPGHSPRSAGGHGLVGMRERTTLLGGSLDVGSENGHFRVQARLPYEPEQS